MNQVTSTNKASLSLLSLTMKVACLLTWFAPEDPHVVSVLSSSQEGLPLSLLVAQVVAPRSFPRGGPQRLPQSEHHPAAGHV